MAHRSAKLLRFVCPKFMFRNSSATLIVPSPLLRHRASVLHQRRRFSWSPTRPEAKKQKVVMYFMDRDGDRVEVSACVGDSLLDVAIKNDVDLEGACEGTLACSTCHLIFKPEHFDQLSSPPTDEEYDMLDLAFDVQETSRLGCQVIVKENMAGWEVKIPDGVSDARENT